jgi:hypothetical protein
VGGYLHFDVAGYLGTGGLSLTLKDVQSEREREIVPDRLAKETWQPAHIACPSGSFRVVAVDARGDSWFAFSDPVEVGVASPAAEWLIDASPTLLIVAFGVALFAARSDVSASPAGAE